MFKIFIASFITFFFSINAYADLQTRCGWLQNYMPAGMSFTDADGTWVILGVPGDENIPPTDRGDHCVCLKVESDPNKLLISQIYSGKKIPIKRCQQDKNLK